MCKKTVTGITLIAAALFMAFTACENGDGGNGEFPEIGPGDPGIFTSVPKDNSKRYHQNPIITSIYTADPSAHVWPTDTGRLYLYPSQDISPPQGCDLMDQYHVYSTDNMVDWVDHGMIIERNDLTGRPGWGSRNGNTNFMWAPDAAYSTTHPEGKGPYFFIFPVVDMDTPPVGEWGSNWTLGVAYSDSPYKGFRDNEIVKMVDKDGTPIKGTGALIDPCFFYDKDTDTHYLIVGGSQEMRIAKLNKDMVSLAEDWTVFGQNVLPYFHEGPWMFTRKNSYGQKVYYLMYPAGRGGADNLDYVISTTGPYGPWVHKGSILAPVNTGDTSHGSIVEFKGQWYLFYHNAVLSSGRGNLRSVAVEQLFFEDDGIIRKIGQTAYGVPAVGDKPSDDSLNSKFGVGSWRIELTTSEQRAWQEAQDKLNNPDNADGFTFNKAYVIGEIDASLRSSAAAANANTQVVIEGALYNQYTGGGSVEGLQTTGTYLEFRKVTGNGGVALLEVDHDAGSNGTMQVDINGERNTYDLKFKYTVYGSFAGKAFVKINLASGNENVIRLTGLTGMNGMAITGIKIHFLDEE